MTEKHFANKTFTDCHNNAKFAKVLSLESFRLYGSEKQTKGEKAIDSFTTYQREAEERFQRYEDEYWKK